MLNSDTIQNTRLTWFTFFVLPEDQNFGLVWPRGQSFGITWPRYQNFGLSLEAKTLAPVLQHWPRLRPRSQRNDNLDWHMAPLDKSKCTA